MQSGKEVVRRAIEFKTPDRMPMSFGRPGGGDTVHIRWNQTGTGDKAFKNTVDEWGCGWQRTDQPNMGQVTSHPLADWGALDAFRWPDPGDPAFYKGVAERVREADKDKYVTTGIFMLLFERLHGLRGFENFLTDLYLEREAAEKLADRIVAFNLGVIDNMAKLCPGLIDGFNFTDDWGTENALMISPALWEDFFKPRYKRIFDRCRYHGWHVWMHTCGYVNDIIEPLIEIGCDVVNLQQPRALGIEEIGRRFAGRICFETLCDIQHTLPFRTDQDIAEEARLLVDTWGTDQGGFILGDYGDCRAIGVRPEARDVMYEAYCKADRWARR